MLKNDRSALDYSSLARMARQLSDDPSGLRVAVLADVSTQYLVPILRALFAQNDVSVRLYEGGYDTIETEAFHPGSDLYAFRPEFVVILQSLEKAKAAFYEHPGDRVSFAASRASRIEAVWRAIIEGSGARVIQSNFVTPCERPFGNYGLKVGLTLQQAVNEVNLEIARRARELPSVLINDVESLSSWIGRRHFIDERMWALTKSLCSLDVLPDVAQNIVDIVLASIGRSIKCVVLDLDNTLWGGILAEDGIERLGLGDLDDGGTFRQFQQFLLELSHRGIILAVCSKNDESLARSVFRDHPGMVLRESDISVFVANWDDKATNIRRIRDTLNIGLDSMVFLDDSPFERNLVRQLVPDIVVPELPDDPVLYLRTLAELNLFETASHSSLDGNRAAIYQQQHVRDEERSRFDGIEDYLRSLDTVAVVSPFHESDLPRIAQLIQRSNQFNLTTRRYSETACREMMSDDRFLTFSVTLKDRFGEFGLISVVILRKRDRVLEIDTFLMSCRVLQRGVEQFSMNRIFAHAREGGFDRVAGHYIPTAKNGMVRNFFEQFGFACRPGNGSTLEWSLDTLDYVPRETFIQEAAVRDDHPRPEAFHGSR